MYDIKPLEEEWKKYKKKKMRPWYILIFSLFFILFLVLTFLNYEKINFFEFYDNNNNIKTITDNSSIWLTDKALTVLETKKLKVSDVSNEIKPKTVIVNETKDVQITIEDLPISEDIKTIKKPRVKEQIISVQKPRKKIHLNIIESSSVSAYKDVAKRFHQSHDIDDSLFLAKSYYRKGNYKKAEYWALQTNKINGNIEESWLIFTKSKIKLGRKNEAIDILRSYIKKSNSSQAKKLLFKIKKGIL